MTTPDRERPLSPARPPWHMALVACVVIALLALDALIVFSPAEWLFDEDAHLRGARMLANVDEVTQMKNPGEGSSIHEMLVTPLPSAPGPLYPVLHAALYPLTKLQAPQIRYLNLGLFPLILAVTAYSFRCWRVPYPWLLASMMLAVPMTWATVGLAYTEIPAVAMAAIGLAAAAWATTQPEENRFQCYLGFALAGIFAGLALLGRQTYLPGLSAFAVAAVASRRWRWPAVVGLFLACLVPLPTFLVWGGLTRPSQAPIGGGISIEHGVIAFAYLAMVLALLAPRFFMTGGRWVLAAAAVGVVANLALLHLDWRSSEGLSAHWAEFLGPYYSPIGGSLFIAAFAGFVVAAGINLWTLRQNRLFVFGLSQSVLLIAPSVGIVHAYFPRYLMTGFPFILLAAQPFFTVSKDTVIRFALGGAMSAASLASFYWFEALQPHWWR